jgi:hypothetical protein
VLGLCFVSAADGNYRPSFRAHVKACSGPDTNFSDPNETHDPGLECFITMTGGYQGAADNAIAEVGENEGGAACKAIEDNLESNTAQWEWVGWNTTTYYWHAATRWNQTDIGFHLDDMSDVGLWAHEGTHALGDWDEGSGSCAEHYQFHCPYASECGPAQVAASTFRAGPKENR